MKAIFFLFFLFIFLPAAFALDQEVRLFVDSIKQNPQDYSIVLGESADISEINAASELAAFLGTTNALLDSEVTEKNNLILIGSKSTNSLIDEYVYEDIDEPLIKVIESNLIITAPSPKEMPVLIKDITSLEKQNKESLSPNNWLMFGVSLVLILSIIVLVIILIKHSPHTDKKAEAELINYISENLNKGYSKEQLKSALVNIGWKEKTVDNVLDKFP